MSSLVSAILIGAAATALLDLWNILLNRMLGLPLTNWAMVGRWFAHLPHGTFMHPDGIAKAEMVPNERAIGWIAHYLIGILFAGALLLIWPGWAKAPALLPALIVGWVTILCGWLILSPGMGNGIAAARTANPMRARLMNIAGHTVFGIGLWASAFVIGRLG